MAVWVGSADGPEGAISRMHNPDNYTSGALPSSNPHMPLPVCPISCLHRSMHSRGQPDNCTFGSRPPCTSAPPRKQIIVASPQHNCSNGAGLGGVLRAQPWWCEVLRTNTLVQPPACAGPRTFCPAAAPRRAAAAAVTHLPSPRQGIAVNQVLSCFSWWMHLRPSSRLRPVPTRPCLRCHFTMSPWSPTLGVTSWTGCHWLLRSPGSALSGGALCEATGQPRWR